MIRAARADGRTIEIKGGGTRCGFGRPMQAGVTLSTHGLSGITAYKPSELVMSALAGTPMSEIDAALAANNQILPFEPMDHRALYATTGAPTIGAVAACNVSGPRRVKAGAARDSLIGVRLVNGRGEAVKSGGRVMKNVTGLDLVKLNCGAHGGLGLLTEVTFKLVPKPQRTGTLVLEGLDDARAIAAMSAAVGSPFEVSGAAHLPGERARTLLRVEHFAISVEYRLGELSKLLAGYGEARLTDEQEALTLWRKVRDAAPVADSAHPAIWRASLPPTNAAAFVAEINAAGLLRNHFYDWGGGLVWLATEAHALDTGAVHRAAARAKGHATLMRAADEARARADVFQPQTRTLMDLTKRVKASFDPDRILNPGRMYAGV
ncbi:MAG: FAD-binding protein [Beijerinckiaceae bacterium]|nr:FAD-binding protein [Beijerinckiaceae bacterium]